MHYGRATTRRHSVSNNWTRIVDYSELRIGLILTNDSTTTVYLCFGDPSENNLASGLGHVLTSSNSPLILSDAMHVRLVHGPVYASTSSGNTDIVVSEVYIDPECRKRI